METSPIGSQGDGLNACGLGGPLDGCGQFLVLLCVWVYCNCGVRLTGTVADVQGLYWLGGVSGWSTGYIWEVWL